jgi:hypothetical protein
MALGTVTTSGDYITIELLASATAGNSPPSGASAGLAVSAIADANQFGIPRNVSLILASTAGSDTMTVSARLWGYDGTRWLPVGTGGDGTKGMLNGGATIGETGSNTIRHVEPLDLLEHFSRLYLELVTIGGTSTAVTGYLSWYRQMRRL